MPTKMQTSSQCELLPCAYSRWLRAGVATSLLAVVLVAAHCAGPLSWERAQNSPLGTHSRCWERLDERQVRWRASAATPDANPPPSTARLDGVHTLPLHFFISRCSWPVLPHVHGLRHVLGLATRGLPEAPNTQKADFSKMKHEAADPLVGGVSDA